jgi:hypothetical protein
MRIPSWKTLTVEQYQHIYSVMTSDADDVTKQIRILSSLLNIPEHEVEAMPIDEFRNKCAKIAYLFTMKIPGKAKRYIKANGKLYKPQYKLNKFRFGQYVEVLSFSGSYIDDLHKLMASICDPVKRKWYGAVVPVKKNLFDDKAEIGTEVGKNDSNKHEEIANDLLQARFIDVYHTAVFFYRVLRGSIKIMKDSLVEEMSQKMGRETANQLMTVLLNDMDGTIPLIRLRSLKISA